MMNKIGIIKDEKPEKPVFSVKYIDDSYDPLDNFSMYSFGKWAKNHPVPEDKYVYGATIELIEWNNYILGKILESCAINNKNDVEKSLGDFYISIMDMKTIENKKFEPANEIIEKIDNIKDKNGIINISAYFDSAGIPGLFSFYSIPDEKNSSIYAYYLNQGGLSLPNRDYYIEDSFIDIKNKYINHIKNIFYLYNNNYEMSKIYAKKILKIETDLALKSRKPVELRDPEKNYNKFELNKIKNELPELNIYLQKISLNADYIIIGQPEFFYNIKNDS